MIATKTICEQHNYAEAVGVNVAYALDEYECPVCMAGTRRERAERTCWNASQTERITAWSGFVGHQFGDTYYPGWKGQTVLSPDYCDHGDLGHNSYGCSNADCIQAEAAIAF